MKLNFSDDYFVLTALMRYSLGRKTYAPLIAVENIKRNWGKLTEFQRRQTIQEIKQYKADCGSGRFGDVIYFDSCWDTILKLEV